jgi:hypothetical protein
MKFSTAQVGGNALPTKINLQCGDVITIFIQDDDNSQPLVASSIYLVPSDYSSSGNYGYLNDGTLGNVPAPLNISAAAGLEAMRADHPEWFTPVSGSSAVYHALHVAVSLAVRAKLVVVSGAEQRTLEIDVN